MIREAVLKANLLFSKLDVDELIKLPTEENAFVSYQELKVYKEEGVEKYFSGKTRRLFKVKELLESVEPEKEKEINPIQIFLSYSHKDMEFKNELINHLSPLIRLEEIKIWEDGQIIPGQNWEVEIMNHLEDADIVLCLISSDFVASEFCYSIELEQALEGHDEGIKIVIPVLIRKCYWNRLPIAKIQGVPKKPISSHENRDEGWSEVAKGVDDSLELVREIKYGTQQRLKRQ